MKRSDTFFPPNFQQNLLRKTKYEACRHSRVVGTVETLNTQDESP